MFRLSSQVFLLSLIFIILIYEGVESKRSGGSSSSSRGSSGSRSSSSGWGGGSKSSGSSGSKSSWGSGSSSSWGSSSRTSSSSSHGGGSYSKPSYGSSGRSWSNQYSGNTIFLTRRHTYYRGGSVYSSHSGSTTSNSVAPQQPKQSETPTITTDMIRDALFIGADRIPSKDIFSYDKNDFGPQKKEEKLTPSQEGLLLALRVHIAQQQGQEGGNPGADNLAKALANKDNDKIVTIRDETKPVLVGSISYFWWDVNLPKGGDNGTNCVDFSPVNVAANYTVCNVTSMIRCKKSLSDVIVVGKKPKNVFATNYNYDGPEMIDRKIIIKNANGRPADEFAWFCPASDKCCEWECCSTEEKAYSEYDPPDQTFVTIVHTLMVIGAILFVVGLGFCCLKCMESQDKKQAERAQQMIRDREQRQPLTSTGYPKQQRNPQGGDYGWSLTPSAPPLSSTALLYNL